MIPVRTSIETEDTPSVVIALIVANVAVFLVQSGLPEPLRDAFIHQNALIPARYTQPEFARELGLDPGNFLPLLTNTFMHAGLAHLLVNMWTLWLFGRALEERLGTLRFIAFYLLCGALASLAHLAFNLESRVPALGASGAIAGVLGGYTLLHPRAKIVLVTLVLFFPATFRLPAAIYTALWFVLQVVQGLAQLAGPEPAAGIAWWAHIGGFLGGLALILPLGTPRRAARRIGLPRGRQREIGVERARVVRVGPERPRVKLVGVKGPGTQKPWALMQPRRSVTPARTRSTVVRSTEARRQTKTTTPWMVAEESPRQRGPHGSADDAPSSGRSMIPRSGLRRAARRGK
jgi:membrane associated rhomboid family serine protease